MKTLPYNYSERRAKKEQDRRETSESGRERLEIQT